MKTDINGCSTTQRGQEQYEFFMGKRAELVQYDYRTPQGRLFSTVARDLKQARSKRDKWLQNIN
jgi:hypothetical protein